MVTKRGLLLYLAFVFAFLGIVSFAAALPEEKEDGVKLVLFYSETCPHCHDERAWLETIRPTYPQLMIEEYEVGANAELFRTTCAEYNASCSGVPMTFVTGKAFAGFVNGEGELVYDQARRAYIGYSSQMEKAVRECLNDTCSVMAGRVIDVSKNDSLVESLIAKYPDSIATMFLNETGHVYLVAWWSPERIASSLYYPDVLVYVDGVTGKILKSEIPTEDVPGVDKPGQGMSWIYVVMLSLIAIYLLAYLFLQKRLKWEGRYWTTGFISLIIIFFFVLAMTTPQEMIEKSAAKFPFPVFVFLVALADGFNPCAFAVLIVLLSLLTHTKSRKKMLLIGTIFILTSAVMYFLFIMAVTTFLASMLPGDLRSILFKLIGAGVVFVGLINIKDFLFFKKGVSVGISEKHKGRIYKNAGKIVRRVDDAQNKTSLILALFATALLAAFVNLVEFGCTALLPMAYSSALFAKYGTTFGLYHYLYTFFYSLVYVIPLFAILANFLYYFKSERLSERQARILKLFGGIIMLVMGMALLLNTTLPAFG